MKARGKALFRIIKRSEISNRESIIIRTAAIILALLFTAAFLAVLHLNPFMVYFGMIKGAFGSAYSIKETIIKAIPLLITALGLAVAFKMQFWNIGGEGQIIMGAFASSFFAFNFPHMAKVPLLTIMLVAGVIGGAIWAFIPAFFKSKWGTNETIVTLMMNYVALNWVTYLQYGPWRDKASMGFPRMPLYTDNAILPNLFGVNIGWVFGLLLVAGMYIFMTKSKKGYEIAVLGESEKTAVYAGINVKNTILVAMLLSGGLCGLAGYIQASAVSYTLSTQVSGGVGFTAIIVAWLGSLSAPLILIVSILFAALVNGGAYIQTALGTPESTAQILQAMILFFVLGSEFFTKYKIVKKVSVMKKEEE